MIVTAFSLSYSINHDGFGFCRLWYFFATLRGHFVLLLLFLDCMQKNSSVVPFEWACVRDLIIFFKALSAAEVDLLRRLCTLPLLFFELFGCLLLLQRLRQGFIYSGEILDEFCWLKVVFGWLTITTTG